ncbi:MAG: hypothetical protein AAFR31_03820 [Cyanobacteria bacterium J06627_8]
MGVESSTLRVLWTIVEDAVSQDVFEMSDTALIAMLMRQVSNQVMLTGDEVNALYAYIGSKLHLIRDIAAFQSSGPFHLSA